ncbi:pirin family protein [Acidovorax sp. NCPPB 4044]|uniref:pirin family protein n=1 Tax=Acidovorax sp. NCPPB 4044 TaxID=2940490 RepID=UPI002304A921|nr:pirin family protein [Acidovorax sp. NCPPB 4044]MDA8520817.1 pirin family protein [Acidovorax sp. NCPPB 4044]
MGTDAAPPDDNGAAAPPFLLLNGHAKDLGGGFHVRRLLPALQRRSIGPFVFFDHFGPVDVQPESEYDVRPHPHIGLATVTYLFDGAIMHRDSLGSAQEIAPGAINWMTAGRGIVHSERRPERLHGRSYVNHGIQLWAALPSEHGETAPSFVHTPADAIPEVHDALGGRMRVLIGSAFGATSPVATLSPTLYLDVQLPAGGALPLPALMPEMAIYAVEGALRLEDAAGRAMGQPAGTLAVPLGDGPVRIQAAEGEGPVRCVVIGGAPLDGPRHIWWNFVSDRKERIVQAADDWEAGRLGSVPGDPERIPLPERHFKP